MYKLIAIIITTIFISQLSFAENSTWILSGYSPYHDNKRVWITISDDKIMAIDFRKSRIKDFKSISTVIKTNGYIFPGFIDLHNHMQYNVLPLWKLAKGQFKNRFEWRKNFPPYKDAVRFNMEAYKDNGFPDVCHNIRWAELKALTGGVTAILGSGKNSRCALDFGIINLERPDYFFETDTQMTLEVNAIVPDVLSRVYHPYIEPLLNDGWTYQEAYQEFKEDHGIQQWIDNFINLPATVESAMIILFGEDNVEIDNIGTTKDDAKFHIESILADSPFEYSSRRIRSTTPNILNWIYRGSRSMGGSFLSAPRNEETALKFFKHRGNFQFHYSIQDFISKFNPMREQFLDNYHNDIKQALVVHLSEGQRRDPYNVKEYQYAKKFDLVHEGLVLIHGVGMNEDDLNHAAENDVSIVWSPFSNLLLYNETLDIETALEEEINVSLAPDWTVTGSKHILDELKIARRYLDAEEIDISNKQLVDMITINPARAIKMDNIIGKVEEGYYANLVVVDRLDIKKPYDSLMQAEQKNIDLVVVLGEPLYGSNEHINKYLEFDSESTKVFTLPRSSESSCSFTKKYRLSVAQQENVNSLYDIEDNLIEKINTYITRIGLSTSAEKMENLITQPDPLFNCEDSKYVQRFEDFIENEWPLNIQTRLQIREEYDLEEDWTPLRKRRRSSR